MPDPKLPKQWRHWCVSSGMRPIKGMNRRRAFSWFYLRGHGRMWRVSCHGTLQCGDTYGDFDRWALCSIKEARLPTTHM